VGIDKDRKKMCSRDGKKELSVCVLRSKGGRWPGRSPQQSVKRGNAEIWRRVLGSGKRILEQGKSFMKVRSLEAENVVQYEDRSGGKSQGEADGQSEVGSVQEKNEEETY